MAGAIQTVKHAKKEGFIMGSDVTKAYGAEKRSDLFWFDPDRLTIVDDKEHPLHDPYRVVEPLDENFVKSITKLGVQKPIIVRLNGKDTKGRPIIEVVDGRRRTRGGRAANKILKKNGAVTILIPAVAKKGDELFLMEAMIALNEHQKQDSMLAKAKKAQRLLNINGDDIDGCAMNFNVTPNAVRTWLKLLDCGEDIQKAVHDGVIAPSIATKLIDMPRAEQSKALAEMLATGATKGASAEVLVRRLSQPTPESAAAPAATESGKASKKGRAARPVDDGDSVELVPSKPALKKLREALSENIEADKWSAENKLVAKTVAATIAFFLDGEKLPNVAANLYKKVAEQVREKRQKAAKRRFEKLAAVAAGVDTDSGAYAARSDADGVDAANEDDARAADEDDAVDASDDEDDEDNVLQRKSIFCSVCHGRGFVGPDDAQTECAACGGDGSSEMEAAIEAGKITASNLADAHEDDAAEEA